jgi:uncharacterized protein
VKIIDQHKPGDFSWIELGTTDQPAAKKFYSSLFGWASTDNPMGPDQVYTLFRIDAREAGGMYGYNAEQRARKAPPHWLLYVATSSADETAAKVEPAGGKVVQPAFDVMNLGRMAVLQDPAGAAIAVWQAKQHTGIGIAGAPGSFCWGELYTSDTAKASAFYSATFGWGTKPSLEYTEWTNGGSSIGGMMAIKPEWGNMPPHWIPYFMVEDCDATVAKASSLGGKIHHPATDIPNVGRFAVFGDPQGASFAVIQLSMTM